MFEQSLKVAALMHGFESEWFVAGGWAIDLFLERETRPHADIEIAVFRRDQIALQKYLGGWRLQKAENGSLTDWAADEFLELPVHEIHGFNERAELPRLEILLNEADAQNWIYRRDARITRPLSKSILPTKTGIGILSPEIVLLYKSKNPRPKDEQDFQAIVDYLDAESKEWLKNALLIGNAEHHWRQRLQKL